MKHYDCCNEKIRVEQFYGADTQSELLMGITAWWAITNFGHRFATLSAISLNISEESGKWCAEVYWSE